MIHAGNAITVRMLQSGIAELHFHSHEYSVNKFDHAILEEFETALECIETQQDIQGLILTFTKDHCSLENEIQIYQQYTQENTDELHTHLTKIQDLTNHIEDLPFPTVAVIQHHVTGSDFAITLACDYRVSAEHLKIGLLTTTLGTLPTFSAFVRLPRLIGIESAINWLTATTDRDTNSAFKDGLIDNLVHEDQVIASALDILQHAIHGHFNWKKQRERKLNPLEVTEIEKFVSFYTAKHVISTQKDLTHNLILKLQIKSLEETVNLARNEALKIELDYFKEILSLTQMQALLSAVENQSFYNQQFIKYEEKTTPILNTAILGTNLQASELAIRSAIQTQAVLIKVNDAEQANQVMQNIRTTLENMHISPQKTGELLCRIRPTYTHDMISKVDFVIECLAQHPKSKVQAIKEIESQIVTRDTIIASDISAISITQIAKTLQRPSQFIGLHFLDEISCNHLVEVVYGEETAQETIATCMTFTKSLNKTPILVKDNAGFFIHRVLLPYLNAFETLVTLGIDFQQIDQIMEKFGWKYGPATLLDKIGIPVFLDIAKLLAESYPERMHYEADTSIVSLLHAAERLGRQNHKGFYQYKNNAQIRDGAVYEILESAIADERENLDTHIIIDRLMIPLCNESIRCLEENIISTAYEVDLALTSIGFPLNKGGPCRYIQQLGIKEYIALCNTYSDLGENYKAPKLLQELVKSGQSLFDVGVK